MNVCGEVRCDAHNCAGCVRENYPGQLMPEECARCLFTEKCQYEAKEGSTE